MALNAEVIDKVCELLIPLSQDVNTKFGKEPPYVPSIITKCFLLGTHQRLGAESPILNTCDASTLELICHFVGTEATKSDLATFYNMMIDRFFTIPEGMIILLDQRIKRKWMTWAESSDFKLSGSY